LLLLSVPFSGKGVLIPFLYWFGLRRFLYRTPITLRAALVTSVIVMTGAAAMAVYAYEREGLTGAILYMTQRAWLSGDVYLLAYQLNGLDAVRGNYDVSFLPYMLHPLTSLIGVRAYDKPLGAMISSAVSNQDVLTGPNPQLPVVLDFFYPNALQISLPIACFIGLLAISARPIGESLANKARLPALRLGGIVIAIFVPPSGFQDTSLALIALVSIVGVMGLLIVFELVFHRPPAATAGELPTLPADQLS
jgi:hypothetical protein